MNKLSHKELQSIYANYLAYDVDVLRPFASIAQKLVGIDGFFLMFNDFSINSFSRINECKLVLHPMSDYTKNININGSEIIPIREFFKICYKSIFNNDFEGEFETNATLEEHMSIKAYEYLDLPKEHDNLIRHYNYGFSMDSDFDFQFSANGSFLDISAFELFIKLFEYKLDVFDMIGKGYAVDINTLKK